MFTSSDTLIVILVPPGELPITFLIVKVFQRQIPSALVHLEKNLLCCHFLKVFSMDVQFLVNASPIIF